MPTIPITTPGCWRAQRCCARDSCEPRPTPYEQLEALPDGLTGEILNGQLYAQPRPSGAHVVTVTSLADELVGPFQKGRGGPGGWWIAAEPELHFIHNTEVDVPLYGRAGLGL